MNSRVKPHLYRHKATFLKTWIYVLAALPRPPCGSYNLYTRSAKKQYVRYLRIFIVLNFAGCTGSTVFLLSDGGTTGVVQICRNGRLGTICSDGWGEEESRVVCRELGYQVVSSTGINI